MKGFIGLCGWYDPGSTVGGMFLSVEERVSFGTSFRIIGIVRQIGRHLAHIHLAADHIGDSARIQCL